MLHFSADTVPGEIAIAEMGSVTEVHHLSCCTAVSESDVGDQLVLLSSLAQLQNLDSCPRANDTQSNNIFRCLPRARLPSILPVSANASSSF